jgi:AcrR family transcriptional regulator
MLPMGNLAQPAPRRRISASERSEQVAQVAGRVFARNGYAATKLDDVAAAAGVTKPILYRHYGSKKGLYLAVLRKHRDDLPSFAGGIEPPRDPEARHDLLRAIVAGWLDYVRENNHSWTLLFRDSSGDEEIQAFRREVSARAREVMAAIVTGWAGDRIPPEQVEPTAELVTSGLAALALWWGDHPDTPKPLLVDVAMRVVGPLIAG